MKSLKVTIWLDEGTLSLGHSKRRKTQGFIYLLTMIWTRKVLNILLQIVFNLKMHDVGINVTWLYIWSWNLVRMLSEEAKIEAFLYPFKCRWSAYRCSQISQYGVQNLKGVELRLGGNPVALSMPPKVTLKGHCRVSNTPQNTQISVLGPYSVSLSIQWLPRKDWDLIFQSSIASHKLAHIDTSSSTLK